MDFSEASVLKNENSTIKHGLKTRDERCKIFGQGLFGCRPGKMRQDGICQ